MRMLIDDLLTLAREGAAVESPADVELAATAEASWLNVETGEASLVVDADRSIRADESRLRQLLENLFRNAVEHSSASSGAKPDDGVEHGSVSRETQPHDSVKRGGRVTVSVGDLTDAEGFYVADDGPGVPPESREAVFEAGYSTSRDGTGFGLRIVEQIAEAHGWTVSLAESESGGARFEFVTAPPAGG
jgi:signal transduction histidine kinase